MWQCFGRTVIKILRTVTFCLYTITPSQTLPLCLSSFLGQHVLVFTENHNLYSSVTGQVKIVSGLRNVKPETITQRITVKITVFLRRRGGHDPPLHWHRGMYVGFSRGDHQWWGGTVPTYGTRSFTWHRLSNQPDITIRERLLLTLHRSLGFHLQPHLTLTSVLEGLKSITLKSRKECRTRRE